MNIHGIVTCINGRPHYIYLHPRKRSDWFTLSSDNLGYKGTVEVNGKRKWGYTRDPKKIPLQLCSMKEFREKICGKGGKHTQLTVRNKKSYGIPQGSPISDILANIYLLHFDTEMAAYAKNMELITAVTRMTYFSSALTIQRCWTKLLTK